MAEEITPGGERIAELPGTFKDESIPTEQKFTPDFVDRDPADGQPEGGDGLAWFWERFGESFSDVDVQNIETVATPEHLVTVAEVTGRHTGEYRGHAATGKSFAVRMVQVFRFEDGRAAERFGSTDELGILEQLGLID